MPSTTRSAAATAEVRPPRRRRVGAELFAIALIVFALFAAFDWVVGRWFWAPVVNDQTTEPQSAMMLQLKLDTLARHRGYRVALLGDSVVMGLSLKEHGDPDWQSHTLTSVLQKRLNAEFPHANVLVMNLALNGAVPGDLAAVAEQLRHARPHLVIADIGLRAFSNDFAAPKDTLSPLVDRISWRPGGGGTRCGGNVAAKLGGVVLEILRCGTTFSVRHLAATPRNSPRTCSAAPKASSAPRRLPSITICNPCVSWPWQKKDLKACISAMITPSAKPCSAF